MHLRFCFMRARSGVVVAAVLVLLGCSDAEPADKAADPAEATTGGAADETGLARCGQDVPAGAAEDVVLEPAPGVALPAAVYDADAPTTLVLLHQTDRDGLCGWTPYALEAAERGVSALALDTCGWGSAECPDAWDTRSSDQIQYAVDYARSELGGQRVVLVGASMGAARTVFAMADGVDADSWVYLSGPPSWDGRVVAEEARRIDVPGLVLHDPGDGAAEFAASAETAEAAGARFVRADGGHGYDLLFDLDGNLTRRGEQVLEFAVGTRP